MTLFDTFTICGFGVNRSYYNGLVLPYLNGTMPPGGLVNIISRTPTQTPEIQINLSTGSHEQLSSTIDTAVALGNSDLRYRLFAKARAT